MHGLPDHDLGGLYWALLGVEIATLVVFVVPPMLYLLSRSERARYWLYPPGIVMAVFVILLLSEPRLAWHLSPVRTRTTYWGDELVEWLHLLSFAAVLFAFSSPAMKWLLSRRTGRLAVAGRLCRALGNATRRRPAAVLCGAGAGLAITVASLHVWLRVRPVPLNGRLRHDAAVLVVAWVVEGRPLPSSQEAYPDAAVMERVRRFLVACDFLPETERISNDPRVVRVPAETMKAVFAERGFGGNDYLTLGAEEVGAEHVKIGMVNTFAELAGHVYRLTFRRVAGQLTVEVDCVGVM